MSESENKTLVTAIHKLKEMLKSESEKLKSLKHQLVEVQEKQNMEKQVHMVAWWYFVVAEDMVIGIVAGNNLCYISLF